MRSAQKLVHDQPTQDSLALRFKLSRPCSSLRCESLRLACTFPTTVIAPMQIHQHKSPSRSHPRTSSRTKRMRRTASIAMSSPSPSGSRWRSSVTSLLFAPMRAHLTLPQLPSSVSPSNYSRKSFSSSTMTIPHSQLRSSRSSSPRSASTTCSVAIKLSCVQSHPELEPISLPLIWKPSGT